MIGMIEVIPESEEVVEQRVRDLANYLQVSLPSLFDAQEVRTTTSAVLDILGELDYQFSDWHRMGLIAFLAGAVAESMEDSVDNAVEAHMDEEEDDEVIVTGTPEILWEGLFPTFSGDLGKLSSLAGSVVALFLNDAMWSDPAWGNIAIDQLEQLGDLIELFKGMLGFNLLCAYIRIVGRSEYPEISIHVSSRDYD